MTIDWEAALDAHESKSTLVLPKGQYPVRITDTVIKSSMAGNRMIEISLVGIGGKAEGVALRSFFVPSGDRIKFLFDMANIAGVDLKAVIRAHVDDPVNLIAAELPGRECWALVEPDTYLGEAQNKVTKLFLLPNEVK